MLAPEPVNTVAGDKSTIKFGNVAVVLLASDAFSAASETIALKLNVAVGGGEPVG